MRELLNREGLKELVLATLGIAIVALTVDLLSWRFVQVSGGMIGFGLIVNYLSGISVGTFLLIVNAILFIVIFIFIGKGAGAKAVYGYFLLSILIDGFRVVFDLSQISVDSFMMRILIASLAGLIMPFGVALTINRGYSFGNYASLYMIVKKYSKMSAPTFFLLLDILLLIVTYATFGFDMTVMMAINSVVFYFAFKVAVRAC